MIYARQGMRKWSRGNVVDLAVEDIGAAAWRTQGFACDVMPMQRWGRLGLAYMQAAG